MFFSVLDAQEMKKCIDLEVVAARFRLALSCNWLEASSFLPLRQIARERRVLVSAPNVYSIVAKVGDLSHSPRGLRHKLLSIVFATLIFQPRCTFAATHSVRGCLITSPFWLRLPVHHRWIDGSIVDRGQTIQQTSVLCRLVLLARIAATVGVAATSPTLVSAAALNCTHYNCSVASPVLRKQFPLGVARQSLDSRLAAAAAASSSLAAATHRASVDNHRASIDNHRASVDSFHNNNSNGHASLSPYTKSTTVRRTSTSLVNVNGEVSGGARCGEGSTAVCSQSEAFLRSWTASSCSVPRKRGLMWFVFSGVHLARPVPFSSHLRGGDFVLVQRHQATGVLTRSRPSLHHNARMHVAGCMHASPTLPAADTPIHAKRSRARSCRRR